ncbi:DNA translocase FtsK 4TM domain-containing protein [Rhodobacter sp. Har01]|uniref:DNA translocase FtsK n=1 Tax=Rhodobacter sp. Har01 TaxID=2883999 RepID=UPI001D070560|nr:DNA translocase FtsK [Rhodobacter sp. Har01]MCB6177797.1 DNA translocase FtsK 4TM domain-containing protein [Rhodobacter sp. Har01]
MASYQARQRDPLLDQTTQAMLERRGRELFGVVLIFLALAFTATLGTYSPEDPGWMVATEEPARNMLGRFGAAGASTLVILIGRGAWAIPLVLLAWGVRFLIHRGGERALARVVFAVIAVAVAATYAATLATPAGWPHAFGLGGLFGETVAGALVGVIPGPIGLALKLVSLLSFLALVAMMLYVTGFDRAELRGIARAMLVGSVTAYAGAATLAGRGASGALGTARDLAERRRARAAATGFSAADPLASSAAAARAGLVRRAPPQGISDSLAPEPLAAAPAWNAPSTLRAEPRRFDAPIDLPKEKLGFLARMRRVVDPEPELVEPALSAAAFAADLPQEDRIRARISDVIRARSGLAPAAAAATTGLTAVQAAVAARRAEPPVLRQKSAYPGPALLTTDLYPDALPPEPPVTATPRAIPPVPAFDASPELDDDWQAEDEADIDLDPVPFVSSRPMPLSTDRRPLVQAPARPVQPSARALAEAQPRLRFEEPQPVYELPPLSLLASAVTIARSQLSDESLEENARMLESVLDDYGVKGEIVSVRPGPVVTMYELEPAPGLKASRVIGLADDIARSMSALSARVSTVPGRSVIGIELPNAHREKVFLKEILSAREFGDTNMRLPLALGKDIGGGPVIANLSKMPHLLIAGTTGSGKSVAINTMILSLLYKLTPEECRLIMIDPKMLELSVYDGIPHLLSPVVTDPKKAVVALKWVVGEMEERYRKMSKMGVRNIEGYNGRVREALAKGEMFKRTIQTGFDDETGDPVFETEEFAPVAIPYIVVIVDEMADLMMVAGKEIEACIQRLAQMARASGIHLIMATQRPSVDVITGTIKANFPTRISFQVTSKIDSRTILGEQGAEQLLGQGDMLYMGNGARITRIHGPFVSDEEVEEIVNHLKSFGPPAYMSGVVEGPEDDVASDIDMVLGLGGDGSDDALYDQAVAIVAKDRKCSTSYIQRKLGIGYNKAARLVEQMEDQGVVTPANHVGKREILIPEA